MSEQPGQRQPSGSRPRADAKAGLDLDALRAKRDAELAARPVSGSLAVDAVTLWHGRLARYQARREPAAAPTPAGSTRTALYSLPPITRIRLWQGTSYQMPPERSTVRALMAKPRGR